MSWERRLPPLAEDALEILSVTAENSTEADKGNSNEIDNDSRADFTKDEATAILVANEEFSEGDAAYALEVLFERGHIYYVDDNVYITPTDD